MTAEVDWMGVIGGQRAKDMSARDVMIARSKSALRGLMRRTSRSVARLVDNPELWRLLSPDDDLYGPSKSIDFGAFTYFKGPPRVHRYRPSDGPVTVGRYCSIANDVEFLIGGQHHVEFVTTYPLGGDNDDQYFSKGPIVIGNDVWIGRGAMITSGVTIGDGAVIGARSLVTKDVRPYAIVGGNPARELRRRFTDDQVTRLIESRWWNWDDDVVRFHAALLQNPDVENFLRVADQRGRLGSVNPQ